MEANPVPEICFLKRRIKDVVSWQPGSGCHSPSKVKGQQRAAAGTMGRGLSARTQDHALLHGHVTTKNPPELDKSKYSGNGLWLVVPFPQSPKGIVEEPTQTLLACVKTVHLIPLLHLHWDQCQKANITEQLEL